MAPRIFTAIDHRRRLRRAFFYLQHSVAARPEAWPDLAELARVACMSPFHFIRRYRESVLETPQATVRRLKLQAARQRLAQPRTSVTETALEFGYSSSQTFARAYRQTFGTAPTALSVPPVKRLRVGCITLPRLAFRGSRVRERDVLPWASYDELVARLDLGGVPTRLRKVYGLLDARLDYRYACTPQSDGVTDLQAIAVRGGDHLCLEGHPDAVWPMVGSDRVAALRDRDEPLILRYRNDPSFREQQRIRVSVYVPTDPRIPRADLEAMTAAWSR